MNLLVKKQCKKGIISSQGQLLVQDGTETVHVLAMPDYMGVIRQSVKNRLDYMNEEF